MMDYELAAMTENRTAPLEPLNDLPLQLQNNIQILALPKLLRAVYVQSVLISILISIVMLFELAANENQ